MGRALDGIAVGAKGVKSERHFGSPEVSECGQPTAAVAAQQEVREFSMRNLLFCSAISLCLATTSTMAQVDEGFSDGLVLTSARQPGPQGGAIPVIGLKRRADYLAMQVSFTSDSRDGLVRRQEIHAMLLDALGKAEKSGLELTTGNTVLAQLTRDNYQNIPFQWAGREDTSKADILVTVPLTGNPKDAENRIDSFLRSLERPGRGTVLKTSGARMLAVRNPKQYRSAIVQLIAEDARANAAMFGPDYRVAVDGIDKAVQWSQVNETEVFLYLPYSYRIVAN